MKKNKNVNEMSFLDHLEELRWHLIRATMGVLIIGTVAFFMKDFIFETVLFGPKNRISPLIKCFATSPSVLALVTLSAVQSRCLEFKVGKWLGSFPLTYGPLFGQVLF